MLSGTCAYCGNQTHFTARTGRVWGKKQNPDNKYSFKHSIEITATCDACHRFNAAIGTTAYTSDYREGQILSPSDAVSEGESMTITSWSPPAMLPVDVEFIPEGVAGYYKEAHDAFSVGAYRATLLLVRSVVEAAAKEHGVDKGSLVQKINKLDELGHIRRGTRDMAHALRILGNDMAHGDIDQVPTREDASDALLVAKFVLDDVYVADALRKDMLARRATPEGEATT